MTSARPLGERVDRREPLEDPYWIVGAQYRHRRSQHDSPRPGWRWRRASPPARRSRSPGGDARRRRKRRFPDCRQGPPLRRRRATRVLAARDGRRHRSSRLRRYPGRTRDCLPRDPLYFTRGRLRSAGYENTSPVGPVPPGNERAGHAQRRRVGRACHSRPRRRTPRRGALVAGHYRALHARRERPGPRCGRVAGAGDVPPDTC